MLESPKQSARNYPDQGSYRVYCPGGFNDGNLKAMAAAEDVELPWYQGTEQIVSGKLLNRMIMSGAEFERISIVIPPSTKKKTAPKKKTLPKKEKANGEQKRKVEESATDKVEITEAELKKLEELDQVTPTDSPEENTE